MCWMIILTFILLSNWDAMAYSAINNGFSCTSEYYLNQIETVNLFLFHHFHHNYHYLPWSSLNGQDEKHSWACGGRQTSPQKSLSPSAAQVPNIILAALLFVSANSAVCDPQEISNCIVDRCVWAENHLSTQHPLSEKGALQPGPGVHPMESKNKSSITTQHVSRWSSQQLRRGELEVRLGKGQQGRLGLFNYWGEGFYAVTMAPDQPAQCSGLVTWCSIPVVLQSHMAPELWCAKSLTLET